MNTSFANLRPGDRACVSGFSGLPGAYRNRLLSLGLTPGTEFIVKRAKTLPSSLIGNTQQVLFKVALQLLPKVETRLE